MGLFCFPIPELSPSPHAKRLNTLTPVTSANLSAHRMRQSAISKEWHSCPLTSYSLSDFGERFCSPSQGRVKLMTIAQHELKDMNQMLESGVNISQIAVKYPSHDYWEIYGSVKDYSLLGKKWIITNRLNTLRDSTTKAERSDLIEEIDTLITEMYNLTKSNGKKLVEISEVLNR